MERFLEYWRAASYQLHLHALNPATVKDAFQVISRAECNNGKLNSGTLQAITPGPMAVIPFYGKSQTQYFVPCLLLVDVNQHGRFTVQQHLSLPIIPRTVLEPAPLCTITLGAAENFDNYFTVNMPAWFDEPNTLTWAAQLAYASALLSDVAPKWQLDLQHAGYVVAEDALLLPLRTLDAYVETALQTPNFKLFKQSQKITLIDVETNASTTSYIQQLIINAWVQAALKKAAPPKYVQLTPNQPVTYTSIFACLHPNQYDFAPSPADVEQPINPNEAVLPKLRAEYAKFQQGTQVINNWQEFTTQVREKYAEKGGIQLRLQTLQNNVKEAKAQSRHMQVLHSIWVRQKELLVEWTKIFDVIPMLQKQRLQRLNTFFKQNFPNDKVVGFTLADFEAAFNSKLHRAENNLRMVSDALHQVENDLYQETVVRDKCLAWCKEQNLESTDLAACQEFLQTKIWPQVVHAALLYWQQEFAANKDYADFLQTTPNEIELLIAEHAQYISPLVAVQWLSRSKKAVVLGNYNPLCNPRFPVQIDFELCKHYGLVENDVDFEDLQFDGVLVSVGNMWSMVAKDRDADEVIANSIPANIQYEFIDLPNSCTHYLGSVVNRGVIQSLLEWLAGNAPAGNDLAIYTCFAGQATLIREALQTTSFTQIPIFALQEPCFIAKPINIFIPVYAATDPGPYIFDRGTEMFDQLLANTLQKLVIIGDMRLFKPQLHSAAGKFAKLIYNQPQTKTESITIIKEADCV